MCPMWACIAHFDNCMRIGEEERVAGRGSGLAVTYDEVLRKHVADMSRAGVHGFTASGALSSIDKDIVDRARAVRNEKQPAKSGASTRHDESQQKHGQVYGSVSSLSRGSVGTYTYIIFQVQGQQWQGHKRKWSESHAGSDKWQYASASWKQRQGQSAGSQYSWAGKATDRPLTPQRSHKAAKGGTQ